MHTSVSYVVVAAIITSDLMSIINKGNALLQSRHNSLQILAKNVENLIDYL